MIACTVPDCLKGSYAKDMCRSHYARAWKYGDPLAGATTRGAPLAYYLAHVDDQTDDCILWPYGTTSSTDRAYGLVCIDGKSRRVHVLSCTRHHGPMPAPKLEAAHGTCHNRLCFNGRHLSWKTRKANHADRLRDGTAAIGQQHPGAKLEDEQVRIIRVRYASGGITQAELAVEYDVTRQAIWLIVHGKNWVAADRGLAT